MIFASPSVFEDLEGDISIDFKSFYVNWVVERNEILGSRSALFISFVVVAFDLD